MHSQRLELECGQLSLECQAQRGAILAASQSDLRLRGELTRSESLLSRLNVRNRVLSDEVDAASSNAGVAVRAYQRFEAHEVAPMQSSLAKHKSEVMNVCVSVAEKAFSTNPNG